MPAPLLEVDSR